jgi:hypothetical protein
MSSTGRFRIDTIGAALPPREGAKVAAAAVVPPAAAVAAGTASANPYGSWLDRMQRTRGRHAAITRNLNTWSNYKNWAERVKDNWQDGSANDGKPVTPTKPR